jgi:hypothetical protein
MRFVLTLALINQHAAIQVDAEDLEPVIAKREILFSAGALSVTSTLSRPSIAIMR